MVDPNDTPLKNAASQPRTAAPQCGKSQCGTPHPRTAAPGCDSPCSPHPRTAAPGCDSPCSPHPRTAALGCDSPCSPHPRTAAPGCDSPCSPHPRTAAPLCGAPLCGPPHLGWYSRGYLPHFDSPNTIQHITYRLADSLPLGVLEQIQAEIKATIRDEEKRKIELRRRIEGYLDAGYGSCVLREPEVAACILDTWFHFDGERYRLLEWVVMPNHCHVLIEQLEGAPLWKIVLSWKNYTARFINEYKRRTGVRDSTTFRTGVRDSTTDRTGVQDSTTDRTGVRDSTTVRTGVRESHENRTGGQDSTTDRTGVQDSTTIRTGMQDSTTVRTGVRETCENSIKARESQESPKGSKSTQVWYRDYWDRYIRNERHFDTARNYIVMNPVKAGLAANPKDWQWSSAYNTKDE